MNYVTYEVLYVETKKMRDCAVLGEICASTARFCVSGWVRTDVW